MPTTADSPWEQPDREGEPITMPGLGAGAGRLARLRPDEIQVVGNPRKRFDQAKLEELAQSIRTYGILEPIVVNQVHGRYELVAGERRLRAAGLARLPLVPVVVLQVSRREAAELRLLENLQREDLTPIEEGEAFAELIQEHGYTQQDLAERLGKSQAYVSERMALRTLPEEVREAVSEGQLAIKAALALRPWMPKPGRPVPEAVLVVARRMVEESPPAARISEWVASELRRASCSLSEHRPDEWQLRYNEEPTFSWLGRVFPADQRVEGLLDLPICVNCDMRYQVKADGNAEAELRCLQPSCWDAKQKAVWARLRQAVLAAQSQRGTEAPAGGPGRVEEQPAGTEGDAPATGAPVTGPDPGPEARQLVMDMAPPLEGADPEVAAALRKLAGSQPALIRHETGHVEYEREAYLPLEMLLEHWSKRMDIGATQMPLQLGAVLIHIPEQTVWIRGWTESEPTIQLADGQVVLECSGGSVVQPLPVGLVYYRIRIEGPGGHRQLFQRLVIPGSERHLVVTGTATVLSRKELMPQWFSLLNQLPGMPVLAEGR